MSDDKLRVRAYKDLIKLVRWHAYRCGVRGHWLLDPEDIEAECLLTLAKCMDKYLGVLNYESFTYATRQAMRNRVASLLERAYGTHRSVEFDMDSLDRLLCVDDDDGLSLGDVVPGDDVIAIAMSECGIESFRRSLRGLDRRVLDALLGYNVRVPIYLDMARARRSSVFKKPTIRVDAHMVALALCEDEDDVKAAMLRIGSAVMEGI